jgi:hypothetical protein
MWLTHQFGSFVNLGICKEYPIMARAKSPRNGNKQQVSTLPTTGIPATRAVTVDLEAEIRRRAYELYEQRGCVPGHEDDDWLVAEREVLARHNHQQSA